MNKILIYTFIISVFRMDASGIPPEKISVSPELDLVRLTDKAFIHISYLQGRIACNGLVFISDSSAIIVDTPVDDSASETLIEWLKQRNMHIEAVIPTHFHNDNLGGLKAFHNAGIPSYCHKLTRQLATGKGYELPQHTFTDTVLMAGNEKVMCRYFGAGHSPDNIVVWFPSEKILFGGCVIKSVHTDNLGYAADADLNAWPGTILKIINEFPEARFVIPGHGEAGGPELLQHTSNLFGKKD